MDRTLTISFGGKNRAQTLTATGSTRTTVIEDGQVVTEPEVTSYTLTAASGSFSLTGSDVAFRYGYHLDAETGMFTLSGQGARLAKSGASVLAAGTGSFALSGAGTRLLRGYRLVAGHGSFALTGYAVGQTNARLLTAEPGSFALTGGNTRLLRSYRLVAAFGAHVLSGQSAGVKATRKLTAATGSFALNGQAATLRKGRPSLVAGTGTFSLIGNTAILRRGRRLVAETGMFALSGKAANLNYSNPGPATNIIGLCQKWYMPRITAFEQAVGVDVEWGHLNFDQSSWSLALGNSYFFVDTTEAGFAASRRRGVRITWGPPMVVNGGTIADAAGGAYNTYYTQMATSIMNGENAYSTTDPIYVRLANEFNGTWMPWSVIRGQEATWVAAWKQMVNSFRSVPGGDRFLFEWNVQLKHNLSNANIEACWPGDDYADIVGGDIYFFKDANGTNISAFWDALLAGDANATPGATRPGLNWLEAFAAAHDKPIGISEWGTDSDTPGIGPEFITRMLQWVQSHRVIYHHYWENADDGGMLSQIAGDNPGDPIRLPNCLAAYIAAVQTSPTAPSEDVTWNINQSTDALGYTVTLSNGNLTATLAAYARIAGNFGVADGEKRYFELTMTTVPAVTTGVGLVTETHDFTAGNGWIGGAATSYGLLNDGSICHTSTTIQAIDTDIDFDDGNVVLIAVDRAIDRLWFAVNGGNWNGSPTDNPATGVGGIDISDVGGAVYLLPAVGAEGAAVCTLNAGVSAFAYTMPSGFSELQQTIVTPPPPASITGWSTTLTTNPGYAVALASDDTQATLSNWARVAGDDGAVAGEKLYVEITITSVGTSGTAVGIVMDTHNFSAGSGWVGGAATSYGLWHNAGTLFHTSAAVASNGITGLTFTTGDVIGIAIDRVNDRCWIRKNGGNWNNDAADTPATSATGFSISDLSAATTIRPAINAESPAVATINYGATAFAYTIPSGYTQRDTP